MKGQACSWADMRKIRTILAQKDRLAGQYAALMRCAAKSTRTTWNRVIAVMETCGAVNGTAYVTPTHAVEIARGVKDKAAWAWWVTTCDAQRWTVQRLRDEIKKSRGVVAPESVPTVQAGVHHCDFRELDLADASVDLVFTDPPYDRASVPLYADLAKLAARVLRPGGSLLCYAGHYLIPDLLAVMAPPLRYWWLCGVQHTGVPARMTEYGIVVNWKPLLWLVRETRGDKQTFVNDWVVGAGREKARHGWQQAENEAAYYIGALTRKAGVVFDPFCGGGTTARAAQQLGRHWITCDVDATAVQAARERLGEVA